MEYIGKKFVKKPVEIEAVQFHGGWSGDGQVIVGWVGKSATWSSKNGGVMEIFTLEGVMTAHAGDWIIKGVKGVKGEFYPCKPDIFAATYAEVV